jgi:hypothetical protein
MSLSIAPKRKRRSPFRTTFSQQVISTMQAAEGETSCDGVALFLLHHDGTAAPQRRRSPGGMLASSARRMLGPLAPTNIRNAYI